MHEWLAWGIGVLVGVCATNFWIAWQAVRNGSSTTAGILVSAHQDFQKKYRAPRPGEKGEWITIVDRQDGPKSLTVRLYGVPREDL
jgi:hypothetical protein